MIEFRFVLRVKVGPGKTCRNTVSFQNMQEFSFITLLQI